MKHLFIVNPAAGKGKSVELIPKIKEYFLHKNEEYFIEITERPGHASEISRNYSSRDQYRIYSVGGDGTLNEVLSGMAGSSSSLAVIPAGSGNDFVRSIVKDFTSEDILKRTIEGNETLIDIGKANGRHFLNISSAGLDAEIVHHAANLKKLPLVSGSGAYILAALYTVIFKLKPKKMDLEIDGISHKIDSYLVAIANGKYYGGGILPAPDAILDDGKFDICVASKMNYFKALAFFPKFIKGKHTHLEEINFYRGAKIKIKCADGIMSNIDGEVGIVNELTFEIIPKGIRMVFPRKAEIESRHILSVIS